MLEYQKILDQNMQNVLIDILKNIRDYGLKNNNHLYITFLTNHKDVDLPKWIKEKYMNEMTIVIQYEYYDLLVNKKFFSITLSFDNVKTNLKIGYESILSFADPSANFGLILKKYNVENKIKKKSTNVKSKNNNVINFSNFKKNQSK